VPAPLRLAASAWFAAWIVGGLVLGGLALALMGADAEGTLTIRELTVAAVVSWGAFAVALYLVSVRAGSGDLIEDYRLAVRPIDLLAVPAGVAAQLVLIPALYWPLQQVWPDTFSDERLEERAVELVDRASGGSAVLLVVVVALGAPIFEELVYRGLLQRSLCATVGKWLGLVVAAAWFSLIHLAPVEYPGLFVAGLVFGAALVLTDRLGPAILAHVAFNVTGLALAFDAT
jgi:membrane protease YdiL (CAAX protease family)